MFIFSLNNNLASIRHFKYLIYFIIFAVSNRISLSSLIADLHQIKFHRTHTQHRTHIHKHIN